MPIQRKLNILALSCALGLMSIPSAQAASVTWDFTYAAISGSNGPFPSVASLTLEDSKCGAYDCVQFTLDPNENNKGYNLNASKIESLDIAFKTNVSDDISGSGPGFPKVSQDWHKLATKDGDEDDIFKPWSWSMPPGANDDIMDAGYTSDEGKFEIKWFPDNNKKFGVSEISMWSILRTTIADNFSTTASPTDIGSTKPNPTFGILSVSEFSGESSNWATAPSAVPVPASVWLFGTALLGFIGLSRRTKV